METKFWEDIQNCDLLIKWVECKTIEEKAYLLDNDDSWVAQLCREYPKIRNSKSGKVKSFNGAIDALNFFYLHGWDFVTETEITMGLTNEIGFVFLLSSLCKSFKLKTLQLSSLKDL